jgi:hypothetical protein
MTGVRSPTEAEGFSSNLCVQTGSGAHPASCTLGTGGSFPGGKARPGRDADHSPPSSAEVKKAKELYLLSSQVPSWYVAGPLYLLFPLLESVFITSDYETVRILVLKQALAYNITCIYST